MTLLGVAYIMLLVLRGVAQVVERYFREVEAASSSLVTPIKKVRNDYCGLFVIGWMKNDRQK